MNIKQNRLILVVGILCISLLVGILLNYAEKKITRNIERPLNKIQKIEKTEKGGVLSFSLSEKEYKKGDVFPVDIIADPDNKLMIGADIFIKYDPNILEWKNHNNELDQVDDEFMIVFAKEKDKNGLIKFSVLAEEPISEKTKIATIYFLAKEEGDAKLEFVFEKDKTNESNIALLGKGEDLLASVVNAFFLITK